METELTLTLFPLQKDDSDEMERLDKLCFPPERCFTRGYFMLLFLQDDAFGWGVRHEGQFVAFIFLTRKYNRVNIASIDVHPEFRRKGIASHLIRETLRELKSVGVRRLTLQVETTNESAIRLYESFGFMITKKLPNYYVDGDALLMEKYI